MRIFYLPDRTEKTLINDFQNLVDMSTFLENGNILLKIRDRFMIFTQRGHFIGQVSFNVSNADAPDPGIRTLKFFDDAYKEEKRKREEKEKEERDRVRKNKK